MAAGYNFDYDTEAANLQRRLQLAEAMQQGSLAPMGPTEVVGGYAVRRSPLEGLAKVAQAYFAGKSVEGIEGQQKELGSRYKADLQSSIQHLMDGMNPATTTPEIQGNNPSAYVPPQQLSPADVQAKQRQAILDAFGSNIPVVQGLASSLLAQQSKGAITPAALLPYQKTGSIPKLIAQGTAGFDPKPNVKEVNGVVYDPDTLKIVQLGDGTPPKQITINGDLYEVNPSTMQLRKLDNAPKITNNTRVTVPVNVQGESEFAKILGGGNAKQLLAAKEAKVESQRQIAAMQQLEALDAKGVYSGPSAKPAMFMGSLAEGMGFAVDRKKLENSQAYQGELMAQMQQYLSGSLARSTTDKDAEILMAPLPQLMNSPEGRAALRRQIIARATEKIQYADQLQQNLEKQFPDLGRLNSVVPGVVPSPGRPDAPGKPSVSNW